MKRIETGLATGAALGATLISMLFASTGNESISAVIAIGLAAITLAILAVAYK